MTYHFSKDAIKTCSCPEHQAAREGAQRCRVILAKMSVGQNDQVLKELYQELGRLLDARYIRETYP